MGVDYEPITGPTRRSKRALMAESTGQSLYPAIQFDDGSWYREESAAMERTIRDGRLYEHRGQPDPQELVPHTG